MRWFGRGLLLAAALGSAACGDDSGGTGGGGGGEAETGPRAVDPSTRPFGFSYGEWGAAWWRYVNEIPAKDGACVLVDSDATGALCAHGQDPTSPVFFLAGNQGGTSVRSACVVPADKALFFPIVNYIADNGGLPPEDQYTTEELLELMAAFQPAVDQASLLVEVDGVAIPDLGAYHGGITEFSYVLPPEPNRYTCFGQTGVVGEIAPAFSDGYWMMLEPLAPGPHTLRFAGRVVFRDSEFSLDVTYELTVE